MGRVEEYRRILRDLDDWEPTLLRESGLPGPRGNLELMHAVAEEGSEAQFRQWLALGSDVAPANSAQEFLPVCGIVGMGRLLAAGHRGALAVIRVHASDPRWRIREGVAMALQRWGDVDMDGLLAEMETWTRGNLLERRAVAAALCEPRLLSNPDQVRRVLGILDSITASVAGSGDRAGEAFKALRKGMAYCWSVAVAACPEAGKLAIERWMAHPDPDVAWIMKENLKKNRLSRMDAAWVETWRARLAGGPGRSADAP